MTKNDIFEENENVDVVLGDHKKAIRTLAWPMMLSMLIMSTYNLVDGIWVAGLGADALAAIGFVTPLFMIINALSNGLGTGVSSLIARFIGAKDKKGADLGASQAIILSILSSIILSVFLLIFQKDLLILLGAKSVLGVTLDYSTIVFIGAITFVISGVGSGILRAEGDVKRAMYAMAISAVLNTFLDPIFIYTFGWGITGAALATVLSSSISAIVIVYWILVKKDTFVEIKKEYLNFNKKIIDEILVVGIPASFEMIAISICESILIVLLTFTGGVSAVSVYTAGMRFVMFAIVPAVGLSLATVTVAGAAYGAHKLLKLKETFNYSIKIGFIFSIVLSVLVFIFAEEIALIFSYSGQTAMLTPLIANFLRVMAIFFLAEPFGIISSSLFQSMGKGTTSLKLTLIREFVAMIFFSLLFVFAFNMGYAGVWWGVAIGKLAGSVFSYLYAKIYVDKIIRINEEKYGT